MSRTPNTPCSVCGKLRWPGEHGEPVTCLDCKRARKAERKAEEAATRAAAKEVRHPLRPCQECGGPYRSRHLAQRFCGATCARLNKTLPRSCRIELHACRMCDKVLTQPRRVFCGEQCRLESERLRFRATFTSKAQPTRLPCSDCGEQWETSTRNNGGVCLRCQRRRFRREYGSTDRQRARSRGVRYEPIKRSTVYERDNWTCQLCGDPIEREARAPHPMSASLDHIIPLARGGDHVYANVQCAHFLCNSIKGDRVQVTRPQGDLLSL